VGYKAAETTANRASMNVARNILAWNMISGDVGNAMDLDDGYKYNRPAVSRKWLLKAGGENTNE